MLFYFDIKKNNPYYPLYLNKDKKLKIVGNDLRKVFKYECVKRSSLSEPMFLSNYKYMHFIKNWCYDPQTFDSLKRYPLRYEESFFIKNEQSLNDGEYNIDRSKLNYLYFDIEVENSLTEGLISTKDDSVILTIGYKINDGEEKLLVIDKDEYLDEQKHLTCDKRIIEQFCDVINDNDIDVICSYNGYGFDIPKIIRRAFRIDLIEKIDEFSEESLFSYFCERVSRFKSYEGEDRNIVLNIIQQRFKNMHYLPNDKNLSDLGGRLHYDCYFIDTIKDQKIKGNTRTLKYLGKHFKLVDDDSEDLKDDVKETKNVFLNQTKRLMQYQKFDVSLLYKICDIYKEVNFSYCEKFNLPLSYVYSKTPSTIPRYLLIKKMFEKKVVPYFINNHKNGFFTYYGEKHQGAIVSNYDDDGNNVSGKIHRVLKESVKIDFTSMYPSAIMQLGVSFENTFFNFRDPNNKEIIYEKYYPNKLFFENSVFTGKGWERMGYYTFKPIIPYGKKFKHEKKIIESRIGATIPKEFYDHDKNSNSDNYKTKIWFEETKDKKIMHFVFPDYNYNLVIYINVVRFFDKNHITYNPLLPKVIRESFKERQNIKWEMRSIKDVRLLKKKDSEQNIIKVILNSIYGLSSSGNSFLDKSIGMATVSFCRYLTNYVVDFIQLKYGKNYVVEVDTDGIIVAGDIDEDMINNEIERHLKGLGFKKCFMKMEKEDNVSLYSIGMKNYIEKDNNGKIKLTGATLISGKNSLIKNEIVDYISKNIFSKSKIDIYNDLKQKFYDKIEELGIKYFIMYTKLKESYKGDVKSFAAKSSQYLIKKGHSIDGFNKYEYVKVIDSVDDEIDLKYSFLMADKVNMDKIDYNYYREHVKKILVDLLGIESNNENDLFQKKLC